MYIMVDLISHCAPSQLLQHQTDLIRLHRRTLPVVQVVLQFTVPDAELKLLQELAVLHDIERIEHVKVGLFGADQGVVHQRYPRRALRHVVERVGRLQVLVDGMVHDGGGQRVVADHVRDHAPVLHHVAVDYVGPGQEPVGEFLLGEVGHQLELCQVLLEQFVGAGHVFGRHLPEAWCLGLVRQFVEF